MKYDSPSFGCYGDSANGQVYNDKKSIRFALGYDWQGGDAAEADALLDALGEREETPEDVETLYGLSESAIEFLNECEQRPFLYWGFEDGNFGLWVNVDGAKEDCEFVSSKTQAEPDADFRGEWLSISDHGNATLYVREDNATDAFAKDDYRDREIWGVV